ncbi:juvenile hormone esterase-like [Penaeus japonicus]|uniref:juvenile hormone esterase-like n=1 Tax=Penaeus japonicus TaxID=27405 RepID=UPI001C712BB6|nr:juvenile hormone esterase-like [Penaeus japonicus]
MLPKLTLLLAIATAVRGSGAPVVRVTQGLVSGVEEETTNGRSFHSYYGIPFAEPPLGDLRLKDPVASEPWAGVRAGSEQPQPCLQIPLLPSVMGIRVTADQLTGSEDCLYLNVFTPAGREPDAALPVMVWIHGGGYFSGAAVEFQPHVLLNHDIVLVVLQYRLGVLGFLSTEDEVVPGNFGLKDQVMALRWVQDNIRSFGGDADRVTLFGESAGAASVQLLTVSPKSAGARYVTEKDSISTVICYRTAQESHDACQDQHYHARRSISKLQNEQAKPWAVQSPPEATLFCGAFNPGSSDGLRRIAPESDGDFIPDDPEVLLREGKRGRHRYFEANQDMLRSLQENFSVNGPISIGLDAGDSDSVAISTEVYEHFLGDLAIDDDHYEQLMRLFSEVHFTLSQDLATLFHSRFGNAYHYSLDHRAELTFSDLLAKDRQTQWISHCDDLFYLFRGGPFLQQGREQLQDLSREDDLVLREIILRTWTNFAATGNPTPDDSLGFVWEAASEDDFRYLSLTPTPTMKPDQNQDVREWFTSLPTRQNALLFPDDQEEEDQEEEDYEEDLGMVEAEAAFSRQFNQDEL